MKRISVTQSFITGLLLIVLLIGVIGCGGSSGKGRGSEPNPIRYFAYVANGGSHNVSAYAINPTTGALSPIGASVAAGSGPHSIVTVKITTP